MELFFVILRFLLGTNRSHSDELEPIAVRADGRTIGSRHLLPKDERRWFSGGWLNLRHMFHDPAADRSAAQRELWCRARSLWSALARLRRQRD